MLCFSKTPAETASKFATAKQKHPNIRALRRTHASPASAAQLGLGTIKLSVAYYIALKKAGVPLEMHLYAQGGRAFGLRRKNFPIKDSLCSWNRGREQSG